MIGTYVHWINGAVILGVTGIAVLGKGPAESNVQPEHVLTASVSAGDASRFMAVDHRNSRTCVLALHRAEGYDVHRLEPGNCEEMPAQLAAARTWQDTPSGDVKITDYRGNTLMKLAAGDGFAWEVVEPGNVALSFEAY